MKRVLVVDDNEEVADGIRRFVEVNGHEAVTALNGLEAWLILDRDQRFDAVISDPDMPEMDRVTLLNRVRDDPRTINIPFDLITGGGGGVEEDGAEVPLGDYCDKRNAHCWFKPFFISDLLERRGL